MSSNIYHHPISPVVKRHGKDLQIKVPLANDQLGEPFTSSPTSSMSSSSSTAFEHITQLPTPIINESFYNSSIRTPPLRETFSQPRMLSPPPPVSRIVSEYKLSRHHSLNEKKQRYISNPERSTTATTATTSTTTSGSSPITPSTSPILPQSSKWFSTRFSALGIEFEFVKELGVGNFSNVILGESEDHKLVAIKIITIPSEHVNNFKSFVLRELNVLYHISYHPCITSLVDYDITFNEDIREFEEEEEVEVTRQEYAQLEQKHNQQLIFLNYCQGGNLLEFLVQHKSSGYSYNYWYFIKRIVCEMILTVAFLHNQNIIHRDIKLENILLLDQDFSNISAGPVINMSDFGLSKRLTHDEQLLTTRCGSQDYISPEILLGTKYNGKLSDSWSVAVVIFSMLENRLPFDISPPPTNSPSISPSVLKRKRSKNSVAHRIATIDWHWVKVYNYLHDEEIPIDVKKIVNQLKSVVELLLVRKDKRIDVVELIKTPGFEWIKSGVHDDIVRLAEERIS
ncbi:Serine/threonine-protein kinase PRR1 [Spathaspora sp. JA1]|nr:Serine/threonine-protein kinase PRR1 [Spathaspora sp. JA1]